MIKTVKAALLGIQVVVGVCLLIALLSNTSTSRALALAEIIGLFVPFLMGVNAVLLVLWLSVGSRWAFTSGLLLLISWPLISRIVGFHQTADSPDGIQLATLNCQAYFHPDGFAALKNFWQDFPAVDVLCLQEIRWNDVSQAKQLLPGLSHAFVHQGKAILSRFPVMDAGAIDFDQSINGCLWVDLDSGSAKFRVYNIHLKSNQVTAETESLVSDIQYRKGRALKNVLKIVRNYRKNSRLRHQQVMMVLEHMHDLDWPVLVAGDLNDTPYSLTYRKLTKVLDDHFKLAGSGWGSTYAGAVPGLKIDYIFADGQIQVLQHKTLRKTFSDHFPVFSIFKIKET